MIEKKLKELGIEITEPAKPLAAYVPFVKAGDFVFTSGQIPVENGELKFKGKVGKDLSLEEGQAAAKLCLINCLSAVKAAAGSLNSIERIVKITVFVNSAEGFTAQPQVANGASNLLIDIFGETGKHSRSAVGVSELPIDSAVEIEMIAKLKE
ncbi:MAG: RidA family protein [Melioribacteraceae bacterium]|nr:RidA family protein [Melioribacteraceae bacterium]MDD3557424.1 RidA family protein [Melioribacteraceae bacterium]